MGSIGWGEKRRKEYEIIWFAMNVNILGLELWVHGYIPVKDWCCKPDWFLPFPEPFCSVARGQYRRGQPSRLLSLQHLLSLAFKLIGISKSRIRITQQLGSLYPNCHSLDHAYRATPHLMSSAYQSRSAGCPSAMTETCQGIWQTIKMEGQQVFTESKW